MVMFFLFLLLVEVFMGEVTFEPSLWIGGILVQRERKADPWILEDKEIV